MGRPPSSGGPAFRFTHAEVAEMEEHLRHLNNAIPQRNIIQGLAEKFTASSARAGKIPVQYKQVLGFPLPVRRRDPRNSNLINPLFLPGDTRRARLIPIYVGFCGSAQVWNWFQNRRYSQRARTPRGAPPPQGKMLPTGAEEHHPASFRAQGSSSSYPGSHSGAA